MVGPSDPERFRTGRRDLLVVSLLVLVALAVGSALGLFGSALELIHRHLAPAEDELIAAALLAAAGSAALAVRRARLERRAYRARSDTEARYRTLVEQVPAVTYTWDPSVAPGAASAPYVSPQIEQLLGYTSEEWRADPMRWHQLIHDEDRDRVLREWDSAVRENATFRSEYRIRRRDGRWLWVRDEAAPVVGGSDHPRLYQGVMLDITERKEAEQRLLEAQERYQRLVERMPALTYIEDPQTGATLYVGPQVQEMFGYTPEEWVADPTLWVQRLHPEDRERVIAENDADTGDRWSSEYRSLHRDGHVVWVQNEAVLIRDAEGRPLYWQGIVVDVTERKRAEEAVREAEQRYRTLVEEMPAVTYLHEPGRGGKVLYVSPQVYTMLGWAPGEREFTWDTWISSIHPEDRERVIAEDERTEATGEPFDIEYRQIRKDGSVIWVHDHAVLLRDEDGRPLYWQGVRFDVTPLKEAQERLREAEERFRGLVETVSAVIYIDSVEESLRTLYVSPQIETLFGYTVEDWLTDDDLWTRNLHPEDRERALEAVRRHNTEGVPLDIEYRFRRADGAWRWVRDQATIVRDETGRPVASQGLMSDITALKETQERLREAEERYRAIVEHVPAAIYVDVPDDSMRSVYVSPQIREILGVSPEEYIADPELWLKIMDGAHREEMRRSYREAIRAGRTWVGEYLVHTPDGRDVWVHDETTFVRDQHGRPLFLQGVLYDITERKLAEQALRESEERLRALDEMKNAFLAAVSHELRSPLTSILGLAVTLEQTPLADEERADLLRRLASNARKLDRLLKDLLDIDRLSRGILAPAARPTDIGALVRRTVESLDALGDRSVSVEAEPVVIEADPAKVERIVENLLANAIRHTGPEAHIWVRTWAEEGGAVIAVEDDGPGIPPELRDAIFEPFRQGPTASPHAPGTGIGLALVAMFADLHGGRAWVEDRQDGGASFRVFLPTRPELPRELAHLRMSEAG
jgi:PAS domain S-box-containing protein